MNQFSRLGFFVSQHQVPLARGRLGRGADGQAAPVSAEGRAQRVRGILSLGQAEAAAASRRAQPAKPTWPATHLARLWLEIPLRDSTWRGWLAQTAPTRPRRRRLNSVQATDAHRRSRAKRQTTRRVPGPCLQRVVGRQRSLCHATMPAGPDVLPQPRRSRARRWRRRHRKGANCNSMQRTIGHGHLRRPTTAS